MSVYNTPGWKVKPADMKTYTPVTAANRKNAVVMGRVLYVIESNGNLINYRGYFVVRPRLVRGELKIQGHPHMTNQNTFIPSDEDYNEWKNSFDSLITQQINKKQLFFKLSDPLVKYIRNEGNNRG